MAQALLAVFSNHPFAVSHQQAPLPQQSLQASLALTGLSPADRSSSSSSSSSSSLSSDVVPINQQQQLGSENHSPSNTFPSSVATEPHLPPGNGKTAAHGHSSAASCFRDRSPSETDYAEAMHLCAKYLVLLAKLRGKHIKVRPGHPSDILRKSIALI